MCIHVGIRGGEQGGERQLGAVLWRVYGELWNLTKEVLDQIGV